MSSDADSASVAVLGLPSTGKTTYLAALYHVLVTGGPEAVPSLARMPEQRAYLNEIQRSWLEGRPPNRNRLDTGEHIDLEIRTRTGTIALHIPDLAGESFDRLVLERTVDEALVDHVRNADALILFVHPDNVSTRVSVAEANALREAAGDPSPAAEEEQDFDLQRLPREVRIVDILQWAAVVRDRPTRLVVAVTAWDEIDADVPRKWLADMMPLLHQYVSCATDRFQTEIIGLSAQGGRYDDGGVVRRTDPAERPFVIDAEGNRSGDLTAPLQWALDR